MGVSIVPTDEEPKVTKSKKKLKAIRKKAIEDKEAKATEQSVKDLLEAFRASKESETSMDASEYSRNQYKEFMEEFKNREFNELRKKGIGTLRGVQTYEANKGGMIKKYSYGGRVAKSSAEKS